MKLHLIAITAAICAMLALSGCAKEEGTTPSSSSTSQPSAEQTGDMADKAKETMEEAGDAAKDAMDDATGG